MTRNITSTWVAALLALTLAAAACGGSGDEGADASVEAATGGQSEDPTDGDGAATESPAEAENTATTGPESSDDWYGSPDSVLVADALAQMVLQPCFFATPDTTELTMPEAVDAHMEAISARAAEVAAACDDGEAFTVALGGMVTAVNELAGDLGGQRPDAVDQDADADELRAHAVASVEWAARALDDSTENIRSHQNALWWSYAGRGHIDAVANDRSFTSVALGTSQTEYGVDPGTLPGAGFNAAIPGGTPSVGLAMLEEVLLPVLDIDQVILGVSAVDFVVPSERSCGGERGEDFRASLDFANAMFVEAPGLDDAEMIELLATPKFRRVVEGTPLASAYAEDFEASGSFVGYPDLSDAAKASRFETRRAIFESWLECDARSETVDEIIDLAQSSGAEIAIVLLPIAADLIEVAPDDGEALYALNDALTARFEAKNATVIDLTDTLDESSFVDALHANAAGKEIISAEIASAL